MKKSSNMSEFRKKYFPESDDKSWFDWRWQSRSRLRSVNDLEKIFTLSPDERSTTEKIGEKLAIGITPYYASILKIDEENNPLRKTHIPIGDELIQWPGESLDPLSEDNNTTVPGLVHRYPDRVLFLSTGFCSTYCRYCTRSRMVGNPYNGYQFSTTQWDRAFEYIESHTEVRDVLVSGGDPLTLGDEKIEYLLSRLHSIKHVEFVRIGTKVPIVLPMRITDKLTSILKKSGPVWMSLHVTHPMELSEEVLLALGKLSDAGIPLGSQTVLLKGVNDDTATMTGMIHKLLANRVRPYYLYQCDPIYGSRHFRTPLETGLKIISEIRGHTTGYGVPLFVVDLPNGGGKVPLEPNQPFERDGDDILIRNYEGKLYRYPFG